MLHTQKQWKIWNSIDLKLVNNDRDYLKFSSKPSNTSHKFFHNNLIAILKSKFALKLDKSGYIEIFVLDLSNVLIPLWLY